MPALPLLPGTFHLSFHLFDAETGAEIGWSDAPSTVEVVSRNSRIDVLAQMEGALALSTLTTRYRPIERSASSE
ncbi:hypothetical protein KSP35_18500 [Aquihabitans sp. G128]|uniref:hypothetical protein n=1 Tax=Aquihabitans sp. G128 TaxID=2849779 RepID=UPI001C224D1B|nr:hypothetical protein [Aquihabitans sp. G128]QXC63623.1 hypothetical protein KSP35_18500 [Aquihabitans sp. G128]